MADLLKAHPATGGPGLEPRWTPAAKDGVVTAYSTASRIWFTTSSGIVTEVYYPTIDRPQIRDVQLLVTDGRSFLHDEKNELVTVVEDLSKQGLGLRITNSDRHGRYRIVKEVVADPHQPCLLMHLRLERAPGYDDPLRVFVLCAPHLDVSGWGNNGNVAVCAGREVLTAHKGEAWLALGASSPFLSRSIGYVGTTDGWQDLEQNFRLASSFDSATDGNIALTGEVDLSRNQETTIGLAFGDRLHHATTTLFQSLGVPFAQQKERFLEQWHRACAKVADISRHSHDGGRLLYKSHNLLIAHEDKTYPGALIASLSIPWGEEKGDEELGGYHLVWTRDMVNSAGALLALGDTATPLRALIYLACTQRRDGGFPQNFWINGEPYWNGIQLDEVSFPIVLARRLHEAGALRDFDPYPLVLAAAGYLIDEGPATPQERWEESGGYSPSTLASNIAGLVCAALFARERGDEKTARFLEEYADFLEAHVDLWTVTTEGTLLPGISRHFVRIMPIDVSDPLAEENPNEGVLRLKNQAPGARTDYPAKEVVDAGFLELVRYGVRRPGDRLIEDSLAVVDARLKVETPRGPCWHRYDHDGYGQRAEGLGFRSFGVGRAWPLLTGERGHYELAAGRDPAPYVKALEAFAGSSGLMPEQVWDEPDRPESKLYLGEPTGAAMPLLWAHAEYVKLLRSIADGKTFDLIPAVAARYAARDAKPRQGPGLKVWKFNRHTRSVPAGSTLRVVARAPFRLRFTTDGWDEAQEKDSEKTATRLEYVDIRTARGQRAPLQFTFFWPTGQRWENRDFQVAVTGA
jgi:glucoamylase